eukprot:TRINITY_DN7747_c0_g1_i1.p1 TRINITY_DN7747_c0_g1~~TRINITY_DN7747_c0_g1_i1.p1  ORF type:complete len:287 (-),score=119.93 TRINITY_DN7747_c0_g1_i1:69-929(-)
MAIDPKTDRVKLAKFKSFGCGTAIASSDIMCELCIGKDMDEVLKINNLVVEAALRDTPDKPAVPPQKMHCSVMAHDVLKKAVAEYRGVDVDSLEDSQIVCQCARVTLGTIKEVIRLNNLTTVEQITQYTKAGAFCKSCLHPGGHEAKKYYLCDILRDTRAEIDAEAKAKAFKPAASASTFKKMTLIRKLNTIDDALSRTVRPRLQRDGGDCEVLEVKELPDGTSLVSIQYTGACVDCASARTMTLAIIEEALQNEVDASIKVEPVFAEPEEDPQFEEEEAPVPADQ